MTQRLSCLLVGAVMAMSAVAQSHTAYTPPRTPDGQPDLQGIWTNGTVTPFERPAALAGKAFFTEQEAAAYERQMASARNSDHRGATAEQDLASAYNNRWYDWGSKVVKTRRTSMILDPPDGRIPALTAKGKEMQREWAERQRGLPAGPEDIGLAERCIVFPTAGPPMLPYAYNNNYRILQARNFVAITIEMVHDVRIIPHGRQPASRAVRAPMAGRFARPLGRQHAGGGHHQFQRQEPVWTVLRLRCGRELPRDGTLHADRFGHNSVPVHHRRSDDLCPAVQRRADHVAYAGADAMNTPVTKATTRWRTC